LGRILVGEGIDFYGGPASNPKDDCVKDTKASYKTHSLRWCVFLLVQLPLIIGIVKA
jgi:hypothetical protein